MAQANEIADLKATLEACKNKCYNEGFVDTENSAEPVVHEAQRRGFKEGWLATLQALGVPEDSPLRNLDQIPFPDPSPPAQNPPDDVEEKESPNMRESVQEIDTHMELVDLKVTSNLRAGDQPDGAQT